MLVNAAGARLPVEIRLAQNRLTQAVVMADRWKQVGVEGSSAAIPAALANNREYNQAFPGVYLLSGSPLDSGLVKFDGNEVSNPGHYSNPQVTELIERFRVTINDHERGLLVKRAADLITQDMPVLALFHNPQYATIGRDVRALNDLDGAKTSITAGYSRNAHLWEKE
jgi:ABC-type transport system substrate-binding protein